MKKDIVINPDFYDLKEFIENVPEKLWNEGTEIHHGRNEVRVINFEGIPVVVKYFKKITLFNRFVYSTIRKTKAQRAYEHSRILLEKGFQTPEPVAYINTFKKGILSKSFYISLYSDYKPIDDMLSLPVTESEKGLKAFARYTSDLQHAGIFHGDYNINNIIYKYDGYHFDFSLIDNNRMRFGSFSYKRGMRNLRRLNIPVESIGIIAAEYAKCCHADEIRILNAMTLFRLQFLARVSIKKRIKELTKG